MAAFSDFLSPNAPDEQDLDRVFSPPTRIHLANPSGSFSWKPFIHPYRLVDPLEGSYEEDVTRSHDLEFFGRGYPYRILGLFPSTRHLIVSSGGVRFYALGGDELGRDVAARILAGARTSLAVVVAGIAVYAFLGLSIGALAAWRRGWWDSGLMRFSELVMALPALYVLLALRAALPPDLPYWRTLLLLSGTIAAVTWPPMARGVRGLVLQLADAPFVQAARSLGCTDWQIFSEHMLPRLAGFMLAQAILAAPAFLLGEVVLSFLDVGVGGAGESWGAMLRNLRDPRVLTDFWWNLSPLALVFATLFCLNLLAGGLERDSVNDN
jgi:peptide/nickel transport system permease protein